MQNPVPRGFHALNAGSAAPGSYKKKPKTITVFGPEIYQVGPSSTFTATLYLNKAVAGSLLVTNGKADGTGRVTGATVKQGKKALITPKTLNQKKTSASAKPKLIAGKNELVITLTGSPGSLVALSIKAPSGSEDQPPVLAVTSPVVGEGFSTQEASLEFGGTATDDGTIQSVRFTNNGTPGNAVGTTDWGAVVPLQIGDNRVQFTVTDNTGQTATQEVLVTKTGLLEFTGRPVLDPVEAIVGETTEVTAQIGLAPNAQLDAGAVRLVEVDDAGNFLKVLGALRDDGSEETGDLLPNDGIFTGGFTASPLERGFTHVRVYANTLGGPDELSVTTDLQNTRVLTDPEIQQALSTQVSAEEQFRQIQASKGDDAAVQEMLAQLKSNPGIQDAGSDGAGGIWAEFKNGPVMAILNPPEGSQGKAPRAARAASGRRSPRAAAPVRPSLRTQRRYGAYFHPSTQKAPAGPRHHDPNRFPVQSDRAIVLDPYYDELSQPFHGDFCPETVNLLGNMPCPFRVEYYRNSEVTPELFQNLDQYGVIVIDTHGAVLTTDRDIVLLTRTPCTAAELDAVPGRRADFSNGFLINSGDIAIRPQYLLKYLNGRQFPSSVVYAAACESANNASMANAFLDNNAGTYIGFSEVTLASFIAGKMREFFTNMCTTEDKDTSGSAFTDGLSFNLPPSRHTFFGYNNLSFRLDSAGIRNGSYETAPVVGWDFTGDTYHGRSLGAAGTGPTHGSLFALVTTGLQAFEGSTSTLSQKVCVPDGMQQPLLKFDRNFLSEEFPEYVGQEFQDYFQLIIEGPNGDFTALDETIDGLAGGVVDAPGCNFPGGDDTVQMTGWGGWVLDMSPWRGQEVRIKFLCGDRGDSDYDTSIQLDNVRFEDGGGSFAAPQGRRAARLRSSPLR